MKLINGVIIRYMIEKFKLWLENDRLFYGTSVILVGLTSFGLGRLSVNGDLNGFQSTKSLVQMVEPISLPATVSLSSKKIDEQNPEALSKNNVNSPSMVVASKNGTKYHLPNCSGAKNIKSENLITFSSRVEAETAGYQKAANCPGL